MDSPLNRRLAGAAAALVAISALLLLIDSLSGGRVVGISTSGSDSDDSTAPADADPETVRVPGAVEPEATDGQATTAEADQDGDNDGDGAGDADGPEGTGGSATAATQQRGSIEAYEPIRNRQDKFARFATVPSAALDLNALTEPAPVNDNGPSAEGQFRAACEYSHFGADDPVIFPGQPGAAHLHMFFGNTETNAFTTQESLVDSGGGTCSGFELNRSAYWIPALLDGRGNAVVPDQIILYYKTKDPSTVTAMPQGLQMIAGNVGAEGFETSQYLQWSCGPNGNSYNPTNRIPDCGGDIINAAVVFPNCWDGVNLGSDDFQSHLIYVNDNEDCPADFPRRLPKISFLIYWPGADSVDGWHLSSDRTGGFNGPPGGSLHADWWGAWNDETMDLWIDGCMRAGRNCSYGQTGTPRQLAGLNPLEMYEGENFLPLPSP